MDRYQRFLLVLASKAEQARDEEASIKARPLPHSNPTVSLRRSKRTLVPPAAAGSAANALANAATRRAARWCTPDGRLVLGKTWACNVHVPAPSVSRTRAAKEATTDPPSTAQSRHIDHDFRHPCVRRAAPRPGSGTQSRRGLAATRGLDASLAPRLPAPFPRRGVPSSRPGRRRRPVGEDREERTQERTQLGEGSAAAGVKEPRLARRRRNDRAWRRVHGRSSAYELPTGRDGEGRWARTRGWQAPMSVVARAHEAVLRGIGAWGQRTAAKVRAEALAVTLNGHTGGLVGM